MEPIYAYETPAIITFVTMVLFVGGILVAPLLALIPWPWIGKKRLQR